MESRNVTFFEDVILFKEAQEIHLLKIMIKSRSSSHHLLENDKVEQKEVKGRK